MPGVREKGKIDQNEWDSIVARHAGGESLASIARSYRCTPPAIRYIVSRKRKAADAGAPPDVAAPSGAAGEERERRARAEPPGPRGGNGSAAARRPADDPARRQTAPAAGSEFDPAVKNRVTSDISAFLVALDALWHIDSPENRELLLEATDRLLRAGARTRIEIERLQQFGRGGNS